MMKSLGDILKAKSNKSPFMHSVLCAGAIDMANIYIEELWGENGKKLAKAVYIKNGVLVIACLSSIMAQEIKIKETELLNKVNAKCGSMMVKKIRYLS
jgi:hypothetical protein